MKHSTRNPLEWCSLLGMPLVGWLCSIAAAIFSVWFAVQYSVARFSPAAPPDAIISHWANCNGDSPRSTAPHSACNGGWRFYCRGSTHHLQGFAATDCTPGNEDVAKHYVNHSSYQPLFHGDNWDEVCPLVTPNDDGLLHFWWCGVHATQHRDSVAKRAVVFVHYVVGLVSLGVMLVPLLSAKGSWLHVRAGQIYVVAMAVGMLTALAVQLLHGRARRKMDWFLTMIAVFTSVMIYDGVRVLRLKDRTESTLRRLCAGRATALDAFDLGLSAAGLGFAACVMAVGIHTGSGLLTYFPVLPILVHAIQLAYWCRPAGRARPMHWWYFHTLNMCGACISTFTAFIVTNDAVIFGPAGGGVAPWVLPGAILGPMILFWVVRDSRRFLDLPHSFPKLLPLQGDVDVPAADEGGDPGVRHVMLPANQRSVTLIPPASAARSLHDFTPSDLVTVVPHPPSGAVYAIGGACPHAAGPLGAGDIEELAGGPALVCPVHRFAFDLRTGACVAAPGSCLLLHQRLCGGAPVDACGGHFAAVPTYPARLAGDGRVVVTLPAAPWLMLRVVATRRAGSVLLLRLAAEGAAAPGVGTHALLRLRQPDRGGALVERPYSPLGVGPANAGALAMDFAIRIVEGGALSPLLAALGVGDTVEARLGLGREHDPATLDGPLVLAGSGTGVAPLLRVARAATAPAGAVRLLVWRAAWAEDELADLEARGCGVRRLEGRLHAPDLLGGIEPEATVLYAGSPTFCAQVGVALQKARHEKAFAL